MLVPAILINTLRYHPWVALGTFIGIGLKNLRAQHCGRFVAGLLHLEECLPLCYQAAILSAQSDLEVELVLRQ
jgi:hypothetical protein